MTFRKSKRGRRKLPQGEQYIMWHRWMLDSPAYRALSGNEVKLMTLLHRRYNGVNNGAISMSVREAAAEVGCCPNHAVKCFKNLERVGFVVATQKGAFDWKSRHATTWRLTWLPTKNPSAASYSDEPTKDFMLRPREAAKEIQNPAPPRATVDTIP